MSVVSCKVIDDSFGFADRQRTYSVTYRVKCDSRNDTGAEAAEGALTALPDPLPAPFASFSLNGTTDANAFAQQFKTKRKSIQEAKFHDITVEFLPMEQADDDWDNSQDPLTRPVRIEPYAEQIEEVVDRGWNEDDLPSLGSGGRDPGTYGPIVNSCGEQYDRPLTRKRMLPGLKFIINVADLAAAVALRHQFIFHVNEFDFYDASPKCAYCSDVEISKEMVAGGTTYHEVAFCVLNDERGWNVPLVNQGFKHFEDFDFLGESFTKTLVDAMVRDPKTRKWRPVAEPVNLDDDGYRTADGEMGSTTRWRIDEVADFAGMGVGGGP